MNRLSLKKRTEIIAHLVEGSSVRATSRLTGVAFNTVLKLLVEVGEACEKFHHEKVRQLNSKRVECDEIWSFVYAKRKNAERTGNPEAGDAWTWTAIDAETRLIISWHTGQRGLESATVFMNDVAARLKRTVQLTTDGHKAYLDAVEDAFGGAISYAQLEKLYGTKKRENGEHDNRRQYIGAVKTRICGNPDSKYISTSLVERQNLTMRMHMRRFTRRTNAFSKKLRNHELSQALYFVYYNFVKIHKTLRVTPAMEAGLMNRWMEMEDIAKLADETENTQKKGLYGLFR